MSYDLIITTSDPLDRAALIDYAASKTGITVEITPDENNAWLMMATKDGPGPAVSVWGPYSVEPEDVEECILNVVLAPKWTWQISIPASAPDKAIKIAKELCCFLAKKGRGAAYDPQEEQVFFPRKQAVRYKAVSSPEAKVDLIELEFMLPFSRIRPETAQELLDILRKSCPEAIPTRFGTFEPLQYKVESGNYKPFLEVWANELGTEYGGSFFGKPTPLHWVVMCLFLIGERRRRTSQAAMPANTSLRCRLMVGR